MKKKLLTAITLLISIMMMQVPIDSVKADNTATGSEGNYPILPDDEVIVKALNFLEKQQLEDGSIGGFAISAWVTMAISAANKHPHNWGNLVNYLAEKMIEHLNIVIQRRNLPYGQISKSSFIEDISKEV